MPKRRSGANIGDEANENSRLTRERRGSGPPVKLRGPQSRAMLLSKTAELVDGVDGVDEYITYEFPPSQGNSIEYHYLLSSNPLLSSIGSFKVVDSTSTAQKPFLSTYL